MFVLSRVDMFVRHCRHYQHGGGGGGRQYTYHFHFGSGGAGGGGGSYHSHHYQQQQQQQQQEAAANSALPSNTSFLTASNFRSLVFYGGRPWLIMVRRP